MRTFQNCWRIPTHLPIGDTYIPTYRKLSENSQLNKQENISQRHLNQSAGKQRWNLTIIQRKKTRNNNTDDSLLLTRNNGDQKTMKCHLESVEIWKLSAYDSSISENNFQKSKSSEDISERQKLRWFESGDFTLISTKRYRSFPKWRKIISDGTLNLKEERGSTRNKIIYIKFYMYFQVFSQYS